MIIQEIKAAITAGKIVACGDSYHIVMLDNDSLNGLAIYSTYTKQSSELSRLALEECFILGDI